MVATSLCLIFVFTGKAPPNLPQGVPPLLHNQYLMGPGGLLPAYPVSTRGAPGQLHPPRRLRLALGRTCEGAVGWCCSDPWYFSV